MYKAQASTFLIYIFKNDQKIYIKHEIFFSLIIYFLPGTTNLAYFFVSATFFFQLRLYIST